MQPGTAVHVSPKSHTLLQQNGQHLVLGKLDPGVSRPATTGSESNNLQNAQTVYPAHYIEAITEQTVYAANGDGGEIIELKPGTPLRKLFASVTKSLPGQYQEYTPILYAPVSGGQTYYQTASGQVLTTAAFGGAGGGSAPNSASLHAAGHANLGGHAQLVTHQGATYLVQSGQLDDDTSTISHTAKASPVTVQWLVDNYETAEGVSLPRSTLYFHYLQHCNEHKLEPMNPASFGKLIRSVFYGLRTRRLGTRGNSKYHYYGIRIKPNSPLNHFVEDAGFSLRHYPNYHRQTMEAAAEWKNFTNSSVTRLKPSISSGSTNFTHVSTTHQTSSSANLNTGSLSSHFSNVNVRSDKPFMSNSSSSSSYGSGAAGIVNNVASSANNTDNTSSSKMATPFLSSSGPQCQHAQFLGEASSALPNLDEICRSSGLPVPSEVDLADINADVTLNKNRIKVGSSSLDSSFYVDAITFCRLYALSAGYMLDAVVNLDFTSIETVWKAFWCTDEVRDSRLKQSLSQERLYTLVQDSCVLQFVRLYDHTFYQSLAEVLIPNVLRPIPPTLTQAIRNFAKSLESWMRQATHGLDSTLVSLKVSAVSALAQTLRRYTSLNHLAQAARAVLKNTNQINQMLTDLNRVDFNNVQEQASWVCQCSDATVNQLEQDFKRILHKHASLEEWAQWLDTVVTTILQPLEGNSLAYTRAAHQLILKWSFYSSMVIRDLTLRSAASFGSFHLIRLLYDEYIFYLVEHKVAAHLGMTPVAVMGEMGRDLTQQHYAQTRLQSDLVSRPDGKSLCSDLSSTDFCVSTMHNENYLSTSDSDHSQQLHPSVPAARTSSSCTPGTTVTSATLNNNTSTNIGDRGVRSTAEIDEEEVDEYLDDEEDVDDSYGDESEMLKEAHASVQAYCRSTTTTNTTTASNGGIITNNCTFSSAKLNEKIDATPKEFICTDDGNKDHAIGLIGMTVDHITRRSDDDNVEGDNIANTTDSTNNGNLKSVKETINQSTEDNTDKRPGSCSPPSIVTMTNPVRKVVRVTTFCDSRQSGLDTSPTSPTLSNIVVSNNKTTNSTDFALTTSTASLFGIGSIKLVNSGATNNLGSVSTDPVQVKRTKLF